MRDILHYPPNLIGKRQDRTDNGFRRRKTNKSARRRMCHYKSIGSTMKAVTVLVLVLGLASVLSLEPIPFKLREITEKSIHTLPGPRIYGGSEAREGQFPFMVFVMMRISRERISQCSASLIKPDLVLFAAHCVKFPNLKPADVIVIGGKAHLMSYVRTRIQMDYYAPIDESLFDLQERRAKQIHIHSKYSEETLYHDIALLRLNEPFRLQTGVVETIPISTDKMNSQTTCTILGWGLTRGNQQSYNLNFVHDRRVSTTELGCLKKPYGPFICLKPADSGICQGDSGSPLVCSGRVWGVASHFLSYTESPDCGDSIEEYYSEVYPNLPFLSAGSALHKSSGAFACLSLCLFAAVWSGQH